MIHSYNNHVYLHCYCSSFVYLHNYRQADAGEFEGRLCKLYTFFYYAPTDMSALRGCMNNIRELYHKRNKRKKKGERNQIGCCASMLKTFNNFINQFHLFRLHWAQIYIKTLSCINSIRITNLTSKLKLNKILTWAYGCKRANLINVFFSHI